MARKNKTEWVVLGLLANRARTGYELKKAIESQISHFWNESFGQLYPILNRLEEEGLAECKRVLSEGRPLRKIYHLTEQGRARLMEWLEEPVETPPPRIEILLKLFFGKKLSRDALEEHLVHFQRETQDRVNRWERLHRDLERNQSEKLEARYWGMTLNYRILEAKAHLRWIEDTLIRLGK